MKNPQKFIEDYLKDCYGLEEKLAKRYSKMLVNRSVRLYMENFDLVTLEEDLYMEDGKLVNLEYSEKFETLEGV